MPYTPQPIQDEYVAERITDQFCAGHEPLLYAADYDLTPEQVYDHLRWLIRELEGRLSRKNAGRKRKPDSEISAAGQQKRRQRERANQQPAKQ